jgi:hypothetical protein
MFSFKKYSIDTAFVLIIFSLFITSCFEPQSKLSKYGKEVEAVIITDSGTFRGFDLGDKADSVQAKEIGKAIETDEGYLYYEYRLDSSNTYNISYSFDENGLSEIESDIFIHNPDNTDKVFDSFKAFFDDHYGASEEKQGYTIWSVKSTKYGTVKINLSNESADFTVKNSPGKISIWIYPDNE